MTAHRTAVPYYAWQNRGIDEMVVWLIEDPEVAPVDVSSTGPMQDPDPNNLATTGTVSASCPMVGPNTVHALRDGQMPRSSADKSQPRLAWWPRKGSTEWTQVAWERPQVVSRVRVYWFADHPHGGCKLPRRWRLLCLDGTTWRAVPNADDHETKPDGLNDLKFDSIETTALRIEVELEEGYSGGIHEWIVEPTSNIDG